MKISQRFCAVALLLLATASLGRAALPQLMKLTIDGEPRVAALFAPDKPDKAPVILAFHGHGGNMKRAAVMMAFQKQWPEAIVVYPEGLPTPSLIKEDEQGLQPGWQHFPGEQNDRDLKFVDAILAALHDKFSIDDKRIYATGFSNGGYFTYLLWAQRPDVFAAFAPGAGLILPEAIPTVPRPLLHFGGRADQRVTFAKQEATVELARKIDNCDSLGQPCGELCTLYRSRTNTPVETLIHPAGHIYPPPVSRLIVKFFREHPRP